MLDTASSKETVKVVHRDSLGEHDYTIELTLLYYFESEQWVGVCDEMGTSAFADTMEQMKTELRDAVELQLNEMERIADIQDYLAHNQIAIQPVNLPEYAGFSVV